MEDTTMKKKYFSPELEVVKVATQQMLAASTQSMGIGSGTQDGGNACSPGMDDDFDW